MNADEKRLHARSFLVHVGVDTAKKFHVLVARGPDGHRTTPYKVLVSRDGFAAADAHLTRLFPDVPREKMLVGLEFAGHHGFTFAYDLAKRGYSIVNVLPSVTSKAKEIEDNSPLKTDEKDAGLIATLVGEGKFVRFPFLDDLYLEMRLLTAERHRLSCEITRFKNRLQSILDVAWPEYLEHFTSVGIPTSIALLERWPLPQDLRSEAEAVVQDVATAASRNHYGNTKVESLISAARQTVGLPHCAETRRTEIQRLLARWKLVREQLVQIDSALSTRVEHCAAAKALTTIPEVGPVCAATVVAELGTPEDYESPRQVLKLAGMNLIVKSSGSLRGKPRESKRGRPELRRQLFLLAGRCCHRDRGLYRSYYEAMLLRNGNCKTKAVCAVARRLVPLLLHVAESKEPFDRDRWAASRPAA